MHLVGKPEVLGSSPYNVNSFLSNILHIKVCFLEFTDYKWGFLDQEQCADAGFWLVTIKLISKYLV